MTNSDVLRVINAYGAGDSLLRKFYRYTKNNSGCSLQEICEDPQLMCSLGVNPQVAQNIYEGKENALRLQDELLKNHVDMCWLGDEDFPDGLRDLRTGTAPTVLFYKGNFELVKQKCVGFTGSRNVSETGMRITADSARQLSDEGITVVSGYAKGVDLVAHRTALEEGGNTIFVLVEGILKHRVKGEVKELLNDKNHLFVSQFSPNLTWSAPNAMKRNNTIIGLSDVMVMIESGMEGGTFHAGEQSLKNGKELFVVEYKNVKPSAEGNPYFLNKGGIPLRGDRDGKPILTEVYRTLATKKRQIERMERYAQLVFDFHEKNSKDSVGSSVGTDFSDNRS